MGNPLLLRGRSTQPGACYIITTVVRGRRPVFQRAANAHIVRAELQRTAQDGTADTLAWVLMPDHLHWLLQLRQGKLGRCMQRFKSRSARAINLASGSTGQLWQSGYYDHRLRDEDDLLSQARYLIENPLRKGMVTRIEDYPFWWSRWVSRSTDLA